MAANSFCPPSHLQLALALAIVRSKPANTTIKDHISSLRNYIKPGKRDPVSVTNDKHIDSAAFWRQAYEKSEAAQSHLLDRIYELEQKNESLRLAKEETPPARQSRSATKRKARSDEGSKTSTGSGSHKKGKADDGKYTEHQTSNNGHAKIAACFEGPQDPLSSLMRRFYSVRKSLQRKIDTECLTVNCVELCTVTAEVIGCVSKNSGLRFIPNLEQALKAIEHCYACLLQCLKKISCPDPPTTSHTGLLVYHMVRLFRETLEQFHSYTMSKVKRSRAGRKKSKSKLRENSAHGAAAPGTYLSPPEETEKALEAFSHLLATMILSLNAQRKEQQDLLEGYLFVFLQFTGRTLGLFVFRDLSVNPEMRMDKSKSPVPDSLQKWPIDSADFAVRELAAEWEAKYILWILDRVMTFLERQNLTLDSDTAPALQRFPQSSLLAQIRDQLQSTLLVGVFGADDPTFDHSLRPPTEPPSLENASSSRAHGIEIGDWFAQELWRLLGWDLLTRGNHS
ncbi:hypothetical protein VTO42DRAFT_1567 [Malbranchea cinnamomea]